MNSKYVGQSNLLRCFRTLGLFSGKHSASCNSVGRSLHLLVPIEHSFISYDITRKLDFLYRSENFEEEIISVHMRNYQAIVITQHSIFFESKLKQFTEIKINGTISSSLLFGDHLIISTEHYLIIYEIDNQKEYKKIKIPIESPKLFHSKEY